MTSKSLRRLASDHASLHTQGLPPNYLFPPGREDSLSDLTTLSLLLAGPEGTPFSTGLFTLDLQIPPTYPNSPPTASFKTKIFHPNVDPASGAVCVDTLKRDWKPELTLRDILVTVGCLLVFPNPASALNAEAGRLCEEDFAEYERKARLWARMHAAVPPQLQEAVVEARSRGDAVVAGPSKKAGKSRKGKPETAQEDVFVREDSIQKTPPKKNGISMPPPPSAKGLGIELPEQGGASVIENLEMPTQPPPPRRRKKPIQDPAPSAATNTSTPIRPLIHSNPSTPRPPSPKRRRVTPENPPPKMILPSASAVPEAESETKYPWVNWQTCSPASSPEDERRKRRRIENEQKRLESVGGSLKRYNSGIFGPRTGIERL